MEITLYGSKGGSRGSGGTVPLVDQRSDERVKLRTAFESVDEIRWDSIKRGVREDCFVVLYQRRMGLPFTEFGVSMEGTDLYWKITLPTQRYLLQI